MIKQFLKDLPYELVQPMYQEYEAKCRELRRWIENSQSPKFRKYLAQREAIEFIYALGIYYRYIIAPIDGASRFASRLSTYSDAGELKIAGRIQTQDVQQAIDRGIERFHSIASDFGLTQSIFAEVDAQKIVYLLVKSEEQRERGSE